MIPPTTLKALTALCCMFVAVACFPAAAQTDIGLPYVEYGEGRYPDEAGAADVRAASDIRPLTELGADAFRFTSDPASGLRKAYVFEARRLREHATLAVIWLDRGRELRWARTRRVTFHLSHAEYDALATLVDEQLERGRALSSRLRQGEEPTWLCNDGSYLIAERIRDGREMWMMGDCGLHHPNSEVEARLRAFVLDRLGDRR